MKWIWPLVAVGLLTGSASLAPAQVPEAEPSPYGVCAHLLRGEEHHQAEEELAGMREIGIRWARADFSWHAAEPEQGEWDYSRFDRTVRMAEEAGVQLLPILDYDVPWASPAHEHLDAWKTYVRKTVNRYKDRIRYWEVWNEPDLENFWGEEPDPVAYAKLLEATYETIKDVDPDLQVVFAGVSGIPMKYIEGAFDAKGGDKFDIMAVHPYRYPNAPEEEDLIADLHELRDLMAEYGHGDKPIWITEMGYPTHRTGLSAPGSLAHQIVQAGFEQLAPEREEWTIAALKGPGLPRAPRMDLTQLGRAPEGGPWLTTDQISGLDPNEVHALLLPPTEDFPDQHFDALRQYVAEGGVAIFPGGGVPLYNRIALHDDGTMDSHHDGGTMRQQMHLGFEAWWTNDNVPKETDNLQVVGPAKGVVDRPGRGAPANRFLTDAHVADGDRMIPLLTATKGSFKGAVAAAYDFNSDLKGGVIAISLQTGDARGVTLDRQAEMVPRTILAALQSEIDRFFWYEYHAPEQNPRDKEHHFGLVHRGLEPKPAYHAHGALTRARPAGSQPQAAVNEHGRLRHAKWQRPDGRTGHALWRLGNPAPVTVSWDGDLAAAFDHLGKPLEVTGGQANVEVGPGVLYFVGPSELSWSK